jgi:hypothetical protein
LEWVPQASDLLGDIEVDLSQFSPSYSVPTMDRQAREAEGPVRHQYLAVSPGEEWILFSERPSAQSELMLMENFR